MFQLVDSKLPQFNQFQILPFCSKNDGQIKAFRGFSSRIKEKSFDFFFFLLLSFRHMPSNPENIAGGSPSIGQGFWALRCKARWRSQSPLSPRSAHGIRVMKGCFALPNQGQADGKSGNNRGTPSSAGWLETQLMTVTQ